MITAVWALAFAVMVAAEPAILYVADMPRQIGMLAIVAALIGAVKLTGWYLDRGRGGS